MQDLRHAFRLFAKSPVFTLIAVLSLALGIGANTAMFSLVDTVLLRTLPVQRPEDVVQVGVFNPKVRLIYGSLAPGMPGTSVREMNSDVYGPNFYKELRDRNTALEGLAARGRTDISLRIGERSDRARAEIVSGNFFPLLGVQPAIGRLLTPEDDQSLGGHPVCVISHDYWIRHFGADRNIAERVVQINSRAFTIVGVSSEGFRGFDLDSPAEVYVPLAMRNLFVPAAISS
ncbi:MAG: ABC transporter permease, partial [Bryobacteraceae bacterium]